MATVRTSDRHHTPTFVLKLTRKHPLARVGSQRANTGILLGQLTLTRLPGAMKEHKGGKRKTSKPPQSGDQEGEFHLAVKFVL